MAEGTNGLEADRTNPTYWNQRRHRYRSRQRIPSRRHDAMIEYILRRVAPEERGAGSVCEIGCAPGSMMLRMAAVRPDLRYHGIDYSTVGIEKAQALLSSAGIPAHLHCADYFAFQPEHLFDLVVSFGLIEHASAPEVAIRRHMDYARPGGWIAVSLPNYGHPFVRFMAQRVDPNVFVSHNPALMGIPALRHVMYEAGLTDVEVLQSGRPKLRATCPEKTIRRLAWRTAAKSWNLLARALPAGFPWANALWALGRKS